MASGTHVGIIGNVTSVSSKLKASIERTLNEISANSPFLPRVLHCDVGQRAHKIARDHVLSVGGWRIQDHRDGHSSIVEASHFLIIIATGNENMPGPGASGIWLVAKKARASGRRVIHVPVADELAKRAPMHQSSSAPLKAQNRTMAWAISVGKADGAAKTVSMKYPRFRQRYGLFDSPKSRRLWDAYKSAAASVPPQPRKGKRKRTSIPVSRSTARGTVPLTPEHIALFRMTNQPDPDVWR